MATATIKDCLNVLQPTGFREESRQDGSKVKVCGDCNKEFKTEQGVKAHIESKHKDQHNKRKKTNDEDDENADEIKKARLNVLFSEHDVTDFEFDPLNTSPYNPTFGL